MVDVLWICFQFPLYRVRIYVITAAQAEMHNKNKAFGVLVLDGVEFARRLRGGNFELDMHLRSLSLTSHEPSTGARLDVMSLNSRFYFLDGCVLPATVESNSAVLISRHRVPRLSSTCQMTTSVVPKGKALQKYAVSAR